MNEKILKKAKKLNKELLKNKNINQYLVLKEKVKNNKTLLDLKVDVENAKAKYCKSGKEKDKQEHLKLKKEYEENILVVEYNNAKKETEKILEEVVSILK